MYMYEILTKSVLKKKLLPHTLSVSEYFGGTI